jgi:hypothetical protein
MARTLTSQQIAEITAQNMRPAIFVQAQFVSGTVYLWSGIGSIVWPVGGPTWTGVGTFGGISVISETSDVAAVGVKLTLSGIPTTILGQALDEVRQGAPVIIYQGFLTTAGGVVSNPNTAWQGRMDTAEISESGEFSAITISAESRMLDLNRSRERRYEKQDQAIDFPADLGFDYVPGLQELSIVWGKATPNSIPRTGAGGSGGSGGSDGGGRGRPPKL